MAKKRGVELISAKEAWEYLVTTEYGKISRASLPEGFEVFLSGFASDANEPFSVRHPVYQSQETMVPAPWHASLADAVANDWYTVA